MIVPTRGLGAGIRVARSLMGSWAIALAWLVMIVVAALPARGMEPTSPSAAQSAAPGAATVEARAGAVRVTPMILPGVGSLVQASATGTIGGLHSWMVVPAGTSDEFAIIHLPSRTGDATLTGSDTIEGRVRLASRFAEAPTALAASGERVYFVQETADRGGRVYRRDVRSIAAVRSGLGSLWRFDPPGSSFRHASLPGGGALRGIAFSGGALFALIDESDELNPGGLSLLAMIGGEWRKVDLPAELVEAARNSTGTPRLFCMRAGVGIATPESAGRLVVWTGRLSFPEAPSTRLFQDEPEESILTAPSAQRAAREGAAGSVETPKIVAKPDDGAVGGSGGATGSWSMRRIGVDPSEIALLGDGLILESAGTLLWIQPGLSASGEFGVAEVFRFEGDRAARLARVSGIVYPLAVAPLDRDARVAFLWSVREEASTSGAGEESGGEGSKSPSAKDDEAKGEEPGAGSLRPSGPRLRHELREISVATGRVMYEGPARSAGPVTPTDMRILSSVLLATMALALLLVLRPDPSDGVVTMPAGFALAEPLRRIVASMVDLLLSFWLASAAWGIDPGLALSPEGMVGGEAWVVAATTVGVAIALASIGEWRVGRSPGKLIAGCEVVSVDPRDRSAGGSAARERGGGRGDGGRTGDRDGRDATEHEPDGEDPGPARPTLLRALQRNAIKWLLPPIAVLGLFDHQSRHRADMLARTLVVIRLPDETPEDENF